jgi:hypothetical protein
MKNLMMGTAIALLASAGAASAQEWSVDVKGFLTGGFGYVDIDDDNDNVGLVRDAEVHIIAELVADNGLTFGIRNEFEANGPENTDESFGYVKGSFGTFEIGEADGAADVLGDDGLVFGPWGAAGDGGGMLFDYYDADSGNALGIKAGDTSDALKISYFTPSFSGFTAGVSYIPNIDSTNQNASTRGEDVDGWEVGARYTGEFSGVGVAAGVGYVTSEVSDSIGGSLGVGFSGFKVGLGYQATDIDAGGDTEQMGVGISYGTGPWTFGGDVAFDLDANENNSDSEQLGVVVGVSYSLAPGVAVGVSGEYLDADLPTTDDSYAVSTWIGMNF